MAASGSLQAMSASRHPEGSSTVDVAVRIEAGALEGALGAGAAGQEALAVPTSSFPAAVSCRGTWPAPATTLEKAEPLWGSNFRRAGVVVLSEW